ncbi:Peroxisome proliferator-activated receptor alpha [Merluccius polli]|uniref:Peroxisome proliferator-activated receptor alpha n=1 Tax=Merluccius polli TaxID=89951 RepID=A0AA47P4U4_MERPO|nr:Peroxisome proliferator-activated receptor alpha [Merluccius polli]
MYYKNAATIEDQRVCVSTHASVAVDSNHMPHELLLLGPSETGHGCAALPSPESNQSDSGQGFFRRTIRLKLEYEKCELRCRIHKKNRNKCQYCRFHKCLREGMSHNAIRFGRIPQSEKQRLKEEFGTGGRREEEQTPTPPNHKVLVQQIHQAYMRNFSMNKDRARLILTGKTSRPPFVIHDMETFQAAEQTLEVRGAAGPCPGPVGGLPSGQEPLVEGPGEAEARLFLCCQSASVEAVTELTEFAKNIPGFLHLDLNDQSGMVTSLPKTGRPSSGWSKLYSTSLEQPSTHFRIFTPPGSPEEPTTSSKTVHTHSTDSSRCCHKADATRVTLLKYGVYEALFTLLASCMNKDGLLVARGGGFITREFLKSLRRPFSDMMEPKFQFATRFNALQLDDSDLALFVSTIICCGDRPGLVNASLVERLQESIVQALQLHLVANHRDNAFLFPKLLQKLADLRELVTEHAQLVQDIETTEDTSLHPLLQEIYRDMY